MTGWLKTLAEPPDLRTLAPRIDLPQLEAFMPIAVVCAISILCSLLWVLAEWKYTSSRNRRIAEGTHATKHRQGHG
ncbi:MAG: hypothetical protein JW741_26240 [Sedimentisphaerales bacterium]|nr:hypothetical protein [Sedimentisphaerales bacterium]